MELLYFMKWVVLIVYGAVVLYEVGLLIVYRAVLLYEVGGIDSA